MRIRIQSLRLRNLGFIPAIAVACLLASQAFSQEPQPTEQPPIPVGPVKIEEVYRYNEEYKPRAEAYTPIASGVEFLKHYPKKVRIEVFYGSWCGDSRNHVPVFLKIIAAANNPNIDVALWAVDRAKKEPAEPIRLRSILKVPTFIVFDGERELGRIVETPNASLEEDLFRILEPTVPDTKTGKPSEPK